jgi:hypothetical protein
LAPAPTVAGEEAAAAVAAREAAAAAAAEATAATASDPEVPLTRKLIAQLAARATQKWAAEAPAAAAVHEGLGVGWAELPEALPAAWAWPIFR